MTLMTRRRPAVRGLSAADASDAIVPAAARRRAGRDRRGRRRRARSCSSTCRPSGCSATPRSELVGQADRDADPRALPRRARRASRRASSSHAEGPADGLGPRAVRPQARRHASSRSRSASARSRPTTGMLVSASIRDITDRKRSELLMRRAAAAPAQRGREHPGRVRDLRRAGSARALQQRLPARCSAATSSGEIVGRPFEELLDASIAAGVFDLEGATRRGVPGRAGSPTTAIPTGALDVRTADGRSLRVIERRPPRAASSRRSGT